MESTTNSGFYEAFVDAHCSGGALKFLARRLRPERALGGPETGEEAAMQVEELAIPRSRS